MGDESESTRQACGGFEFRVLSFELRTEGRRQEADGRERTKLGVMSDQ